MNIAKDEWLLIITDFNIKLVLVSMGAIFIVFIKNIVRKAENSERVRCIKMNLNWPGNFLCLAYVLVKL